MSKEYVVWVFIEEVDEEHDHYVELEDTLTQVLVCGDLEEAQEYIEGLI